MDINSISGTPISAELALDQDLDLAVRQSTMEKQAVTVHNRVTAEGFEKTQPPELEGSTSPVSMASTKEAVNDICRMSSSGNVVLDLAEILKELHKFGLNQYKYAKEARHAERDSVMAACEGQADKMREQAEDERISGWVSAGFSMASGILQIGIGARSSYKASTVGTKSINPNKVSMETRIQSANRLAEGGSNVLEATGQLISTQFNYQAKNREADEKLLEGEQKLHESAMDDEKARVDYYRDMMNDCKEKLEKILTNALETSKKITAKA